MSAEIIDANLNVISLFIVYFLTLILIILAIWIIEITLIIKKLIFDYLKISVFQEANKKLF